LRILYISHLHPPKDQPLQNVGGMQNVSVQMVKAIRRRDDVQIETLILHSSWKFIGLKTFFFLATLLWKIPGKIRSFKPDVILFSSMVTAGVLPFFIKKLSVPCVTINHGQDVTLPVKIYQWYLPYIFNRLQGVISVSSATRQACIERGMNPEIGVALPNGYDVKVQRNLPDKKTARKEIEKTFEVDLKRSKLLLTVGRQVKRKGHQWFIREVMEKINSDVIYLIVGDGPEHENIIRAKNTSKVKDKIILAGKLSAEKLNTCYAAADLFVMPNIPVEGDMEGFGIVLLEANRAGVPAIASDLEGIRDVIEPGLNGYRVPHAEPRIFAEKIDEILKNGLDKLSISAKEYVTKHFNWDTVVERYLLFLRTLNESDKSSGS
jgi:phosphatidyl-myo-inositol dimannoside synthase